MITFAADSIFFLRRKTMYRDFTNIYSLSKTLRFGLIPQGDTLRNIEVNGILADDADRAEEKKKVQKLADDYQKAFIERALAGIDLPEVPEFIRAYHIPDKERETENDYPEIWAEKLRKRIVNAFKRDKMFPLLFTGKMYSDVLPSYYADNPDALSSLSYFEGFTTYFEGYNRNRMLMYSDERKLGAVASRAIDDNLPIFADNMRKMRLFLDTAPDVVAAAEKELASVLDGRYISDVFDTESYGEYVTQRGIDVYNQLIGGYFLQSGVKVRGVNEYISMFNNSEKGRTFKLPFFTQLKKQILSDRTTLSFLPPQFTNDDEVIEALLDFDKSFMESMLPLADLITKLNDFDKSGIYISAKPKELNDFSNAVFGSWHYISDLLRKKYDSESGVPVKKRTSKKYMADRERYFKKVTAYAVDELDKMPGIDGKISIYMSGAAKLYKGRLDAARAQFLKSVENRSDSDRSLRIDSKAKAAIKNYLDAANEFVRFANILSTALSDKDFVFYNVFDDCFEGVGDIRKIYDKTRNYLSGKLYTKELIKLNFGSSVFLGGWSESVEATKLGTILLKNGRYYLAIIAKGQGDLFSSVPDAKTDDYYLKMRYNVISGASKTLPHIFFSSKGVKRFNPSDEILRIKENGSFKKGKSFNLDDCHKLIDYYKDCIAQYEPWFVYDFNFSDTSDYEDVSAFYREVEAVGYSVEYKPIDTVTIDRFVSEGRIYLFEIWNKDFSPKSHGKQDLSTMYWKAIFDPRNKDLGVYRLNGGAEMFFRRASIKDADIIRHKAGDVVRAKNPLNPCQEKTLKYDIIKDRRFTMDKFQFNVPITLNAKCPAFTMFNNNARLAIKEAEKPYVIGVSRGENNLIYITVLDSDGKLIESRSLNVIESVGKQFKISTDYGKLLADREAARDAERKSWESIEGIKQLKDGYLGQVVKVLGDLMIKYDAVIAIEDLSAGFKQSRQKIERAVYQQLEKKLITKLNYFVDKNTDSELPGGVFRAYQLTAPFQDMKRIGSQTGFIFYVSPWLTTSVDSNTGFANFFDTRFVNIAKAKEFWHSFDRITYDEEVKAYRFDFDYVNFVNDPRRIDLIEGTRTCWSVFSQGTRINEVRTDKGRRFERVKLTSAMTELLEFYGVSTELSDLREAFCAVREKGFHEDLLKLFGLTVKMRDGADVVSPVMDPETREFFRMPADENGAYNIARKGLMVIDRIRDADNESLVAKDPKERTSLLISGGQWLRFLQNQ